MFFRKHSYNSRGLAAGLRHLALTALLAGGTTAVQAQFYSASNTVNKAGTYTGLGTSGTAIATANTDDANSAATPIGFLSSQPKAKCFCTFTLG